MKAPVFMFSCFFFFLISALFCPSFSSPPLLLYILKPNIGPPNEVLDKNLLLFWRAGTTPILEKTLRECKGK